MTSTTWTMSSRVGPRARALAIGLALAVLSSLPAAASEDTAGARAVVDETMAEVLEVLSDAALTQAQRQDRIEGIALEHFDWRTISRLVLARNWRRFSPEQQDAFVEQFKGYLSVNYGTRIERFDQQSVDVLGERVEPRGDVTVKTKIVGGEADGVTIDYRLRKRDGPWLVIDVVIEGVSVVSSFRSQFQEVLADGSPDDLLQRLREKDLETDSGKAPATPTAG